MHESWGEICKSLESAWLPSWTELFFYQMVLLCVNKINNDHRNIWPIIAKCLMFPLYIYRSACKCIIICIVKSLFLSVYFKEKSKTHIQLPLREFQAYVHISVVWQVHHLNHQWKLPAFKQLWIWFRGYWWFWHWWWHLAIFFTINIWIDKYVDSNSTTLETNVLSELL